MWVVDPKQVTLACGAQLLLLDTEGMASMDQDETYDAQIFSLSLLLSSYFVLNSMGVIDEAALDRLFLVSEISKHISVSGGKKEGEEGEEGEDKEDGKNERELGSVFPPFLWLLRDFVVELRHDGEKISEDEYLEHALEPRTGADGKKVSRRAVKSNRNNTRNHWWGERIFYSQT